MINKKHTFHLTKGQYIAMGLSLFLYILMLTRVFFTLPINPRALIDLIIISNSNKVASAIQFLPDTKVSPYYIQLCIDTLFVSLFYPLLISIFHSSILLATTLSLSGVGDIIENGISLYYITNREPKVTTLFISSIATNVKFSFLAISLIIIVVKILRNRQ